MNREQVRDTLSEIATQAHESVQAGQRAYDVARRLESALAAPFDPPVVEPPTPEPEPEPPTRPTHPEPSGFLIFMGEFGDFSLIGEGEHSSLLTLADMTLFIRATVIVAGGVRLSVVTLSHSWLGAPEQRGAAVLPAYEFVTEGGAKLISKHDDVVIPPAQSLTVWGYEATEEYLRNPAPWALRVNFWEAYAADTLPAEGAADALAPEYAKIIEKDLEDLLDNPQSIGPYLVAWDKEGYGHGGQGIEPDGTAWRKTSAGLALAFEVAMSTMNRMQICITDEHGVPGFDSKAAYTTTHDAKLPPEYDWNPHDPSLPAYAAKLDEWKRIDGQHFARVYRDLVFLLKMCPRFEPARQAMRVVANWLAASSLANGFDSGWDSNPHYWSLPRKIEEVRKSPGVPSKFCGRAGVHEWRFAFEFLELFGLPHQAGEDGELASFMLLVFGHYSELFATAMNENGVSYGEPASVVDHAPRSWGKQLAAQPRELRLAELLVEDISQWFESEALGVARPRGLDAMIRGGNKLHDYLGTNAGAAINLETNEKAGSEHWGFPLATHGVVPEGLEKLKADAASRSVEGGGSQPLNYDRLNLLGVGPRRGIVS